MKKEWKIALLALIIIINCIFAYYPHFSYPYPINSDEYAHIARAELISNSHKLPFINPYLAYPVKSVNLESGFHFMLAFLFLLIPGSPVLLYKFFILIFMIINSLLLFYLVMLWFKNYWISLVSVLFYGTIRSTPDFLAHQYFLPLTFGTSLFFLLLIFFHKFYVDKSNKHLYLFFITLLISVVSYPPTLTFLAGVMLFYFISMNHNLAERLGISKKKLFNYLIEIGAILIIILFILIKLNFLTDYLIFDASWTPVQAKYSPIFFFGIIPSILAVFGIFSLLNTAKPKIILYWALFSIIQIYLFYVFNFTVLLPFIRLFLFYLIGVSILAGVGAVSLIPYVNRFFSNKHKIMSVLLIIVLIFSHYVFVIVMEKNKEINPIIDNKTYNALIYLKENYNEKSIVIADGLTSAAVTPITGNYVVGVIESNIGGGEIGRSNKILTKETCDKKKVNIEKTGATISDELEYSNPFTFFILSKEKINCSEFLELVYDKEPFIYKVI